MTPDIFFINKCSSLHQNNTNSDHLGGFNERHIIKFFDHQPYSEAAARKCYVKRCSQKFRETDRKKPVSEFLFLQGLDLQRYLKRDTGVFLSIFQNF